MAVVIRHGGKNPIQVVGWQDCLKLRLLEWLYGRPGAPKTKALADVLIHDRSYILDKWGHRISQEDVDDTLKMMFVEGLINVSIFVCECCKNIDHKPEETLKHALNLALTDAGYDRVPEHIFP